MKSPITPGTYVRINGVSGAARVAKWLPKERVILLDRKLGGLWTYDPTQLIVMSVSEAAPYIRADARKAIE